MNKVKTIKVKNEDGSISEESYSIAADALNIDMVNGKNVQETIGTIDVDKDGDIATQLNKKINKSDIIDNLNSSDNNKVLSAKQGKVLGDAVTALNTNINKKIYYFNTVAEMKSANLKENDVVQTLGYYEANDGGKATFIVTNSINNKTFQIVLENNFYCDLIIENNEINIRQIGARPMQIEGTKTDCKPYIEKYLNLLKYNERRIKLYIPDGIWYCSPTEVFYNRGFYIYGNECMTQKTASNKGTIITTLNENQNLLWKIGNDNTMMTNVVLKNILFSTSDYIWNNNTNTFIFNKYKEVSDTCVRITNTQFMVTDNLFFENIWGQALGINSSWEMYFKVLNFRAIAGFDKAVLNFEHVASLGGNITACSFDNLMFEGFSKHLIQFSEGCGIGHCDFKTINVEDYKTTYIGETSTIITDTTDFTGFVHNAVFNIPDNGYAEAITVNNILFNNIATDYRTFNQINYVFDSIVKTGDLSQFNIIINNIVTVGIGKNCNLVLQEENKNVSSNSTLTFNNCTGNSTSYGFIFNLNGFRGNIDADNLNLNLPNEDKLYKVGGFDGFYNFIRTGVPSIRGYLYYDKDCINHLKIAVKPLNVSENGNKIFARFPSFTNIFKIRCKIPNGETAQLQYRDEAQSAGSNITVNMIGTGEYKWYNLFTENPSENGNIQIGSSTLNTDLLIDCVKYN